MSRIQDAIAGQEPEQKPNYLMEMLTSEASVVAMAGSVTAGAALMLVAGPAIGALPILAAVAGESLAALFVPSSPGFRASVDRRHRTQRRERRRTNLENELATKVTRDESKMKRYQRMRERVSSLSRLVKDRSAALGETQIESLDEATVDYLALWLALIAMNDPQTLQEEDGLKRRLALAEKQLKEASSPVDRKHLERAHQDLTAMLRRRESVRSRALSVDTAMLSMADAFEEVYQRIVANPSSTTDVSYALDEAIEHLRVEEELDLAVDQELESLVARRRQAI
jgi:hypothetical protein